MKAIVGLGNPGIKYIGTRHNIGFEIVEKLGALPELSGDKFKESTRLFAETALKKMPSGEHVLLVRPTTYMNDSGKAIIAIKSWYKLELIDFLIVHDDVSIPLGKIRLQKDGGAGGQHGVESIIACLGGSKAFNRLKVGIGPDPGGDMRANYVLQKFSDKEKTITSPIIEVSAKACLNWLSFGVDLTMNEFNGINLCATLQQDETREDNI